jgi:uncharacterized membrane protein YbhN (UPF0104 family)
MINMKRAVLLVPLYVAAMLAVDAVFHPFHRNAGKSVPVWIVVGFIASALFVVAVGIWYITRRAGGKIPQKREHAYIAILVGVMVSGFVGDTVSGIAAIFLGGRSLWVMAASCAVAYVVLLWVIAFTVKVLDGRTGDVDERSGSPH